MVIINRYDLFNNTLTFLMYIIKGLLDLPKKTLNQNVQCFTIINIMHRVIFGAMFLSKLSKHSSFFHGSDLKKEKINLVVHSLIFTSKQKYYWIGV